MKHRNSLNEEKESGKITTHSVTHTSTTTSTGLYTNHHEADEGQRELPLLDSTNAKQHKGIVAGKKKKEKGVVAGGESPLLIRTGKKIMSLTESLPHLFRKRTLQRKLELLAQADEIVGAGTLPIAEDEERCLNSGRDSFTEGSVLFGEDILYEDDLTSPRRPLLLNASIDIRQEGHPSSNGAGLGDGGDYLKRSYFPSEPGLPDKNKDVRWVRVLASCVCLSSNGVQYSLSQFMPYVNAELGKNCMASAISLLICFFTFGCIFQGVFLAKYMSSPRASVLVTSPLVFALVLSAVALKMRMPWLIQASFALTGFGIGPSYLSAIIHLQFWLPQSPALASSIAMAFGGFGSVMMAMGIEFLVHNYGTSASFVMLALTLFGLQVGGGLFLQMPDLSHSHAKDLLVSHRSKMDASVRFTKSKDTDAFKSGLGIEHRA
jgi:hypothetical protein